MSLWNHLNNLGRTNWSSGLIYLSQDSNQIELNVFEEFIDVSGRTTALPIFINLSGDLSRTRIRPVFFVESNTYVRDNKPLL